MKIQAETLTTYAVCYVALCPYCATRHIVPDGSVKSTVRCNHYKGFDYPTREFTFDEVVAVADATGAP